MVTVTPPVGAPVETEVTVRGGIWEYAWPLTTLTEGTYKIEVTDSHGNTTGEVSVTLNTLSEV
jgi:hypothetical protein